MLGVPRTTLLAKMRKLGIARPVPTVAGGGTGNDGVVVQAVGILRLYDMQIQNFTNNDIQFTATSGNLEVYDSKINDSGHDGLLLQASGAQAYVLTPNSMTTHSRAPALL
jgi:hypothetical protein